MERYRPGKNAPVPEPTDPHDAKVRSVPLPPDDEVIAQENQNPEVAGGGGEWPDPDEPPQDPAPGTAGEPEAPPTGEVVSAAGTFEPMREVLEADPVSGGSSSTPDDDEDTPRPPASLL